MGNKLLYNNFSFRFFCVCILEIKLKRGIKMKGQFEKLWLIGKEIYLQIDGQIYEIIPSIEVLSEDETADEAICTGILVEKVPRTYEDFVIEQKKQAIIDMEFLNKLEDGQCIIIIEK